MNQNTKNSENIEQPVEERSKVISWIKDMMHRYSIGRKDLKVVKKASAD